MFAVYDIYDSILLHAIQSGDFQNKSLLSQSVVLVLCLQCLIYTTIFLHAIHSDDFQNQSLLSQSVDVYSV